VDKITGAKKVENPYSRNAKTLTSHKISSSMKYEVSDVECSMGFSDGGLGSNVVTVTFAT